MFFRTRSSSVEKLGGGWEKLKQAEEVIETRAGGVDTENQGRSGQGEGCQNILEIHLLSLVLSRFAAILFPLQNLYLLSQEPLCLCRFGIPRRQE